MLTTMSRVPYFAVFCAILLGGCGGGAVLVKVNPETTKDLGTEQVFNRNYVLGSVATAYIGEPIAKVKEYYLNKKQDAVMIPTQDFTHEGKANDIGLQLLFKGQKDAKYPIIGKTNFDNLDLTIVSVPWMRTDLKNQELKEPSSSRCPCIMVMDSGNIYGKIKYNAYVEKGALTTKPSDVKLIRSNLESTISRPGSTNFELVYSGTDGKSLHITYREYTSDNMARQAFFQDLTYDLNTEIVQFRKLKIEVHEATNQNIKYTVLEDGL